MTPDDLVEIEQIHQLKYRYAIMGFLRGAMSDTSMITSHRVHQPEIALTGPGTASGVWALDDLNILTDAGLDIRGASF